MPGVGEPGRLRWGGFGRLFGRGEQASGEERARLMSDGSLDSIFARINTTSVCSPPLACCVPGVRLIRVRMYVSVCVCASQEVGHAPYPAVLAYIIGMCTCAACACTISTNSVNQWSS